MRNIVNLFVAVMTAALIMGCGGKSKEEKPGCKLLYKRYKDCGKKKDSKKSFLGGLSESTFVELCEKMKEKSAERADAEIACSKEKDCDKFQACIKDIGKKRRAERAAKRWKEAAEKMKTGDYSSALSFCRFRKDDLTDELKKECAALPEKAFGAMVKDITAKRDAGKVDYKEVNCYRLKSVAKDMGADKVKAAETLCKEVDLARNVKRARADVEKRLTGDRPFQPYHCWLEQLAKLDELGSPYSKKIKAELVELCFKKLGKVILQKKVPKMRTYCSVKRTYQGIQKFGIKDPEIDKLMEQAKKACDKK